MDGKVCRLCGKEYYKGTRNWTQYEDSLYCSRECFGKARSEAADKNREATVKQCRQCGKDYSPNYGQWTQFEESKYCSHECSVYGQRKSIELVFAQIRIDPVTGCHVWTGYKNAGGYGRSRIQGTRQMVHRIVWEHKNGPVPEGLELDHICRNTSCCNPEHLRAVTSKENTLAGYNPCARNARKSHCPVCGSEFSPRKNGGRYCRPCHIKKNSEYAKQKSAEDPAYRESRLEATRRYEDKRRTDPGAIQRGSTRPLNENCPKCGGPYSTFPNGARYCKPCRQTMLAAYRVQQAKLKQEKD